MTYLTLCLLISFASISILLSPLIGGRDTGIFGGGYTITTTATLKRCIYF